MKFRGKDKEQKGLSLDDPGTGTIRFSGDSYHCDPGFGWHCWRRGELRRASFTSAVQEQALGLSHKFPSESSTEHWEESQAWRYRGRAPSPDIRHGPRRGTRLSMPTCNALREIPGQNNNYHSRSITTTHRINSKVHLGQITAKRCRETCRNNLQRHEE